MRKLWINICVFLFAAASQAQDIKEILFSKGFENVQVLENGDGIKIFFEHREFRNPFHSMSYADLLLVGLEGKTITWIPILHILPIGKYLEDDLNFQKLTLEDRRFFKEKNRPFKNYRLRFRLRPDFSARFGYYNNPFQTKFNLILDTQIYFADGLSLQTGIAFPITNELDNQNMKPRLAPSMLYYFAQPFSNSYVALSIGTFHYDRYGIDLQYRYTPLNSRWSFGLESGFTGFYWLNGTDLYREDLDDLYAVADIEYRLPLENLNLKLSAGQFLFSDKGVRADLIKQFGTVDIGLFVSATQAGSTGGFQFAFSFPPGKIFRSRMLELGTTEEFRWEYSYNNVDPVARKYRLGIPRLSDILRQYNSHSH